MVEQEKLLLILPDKLNEIIEILEFYKDQVELVFRREHNKKRHEFDLLAELLEEIQRVDDLIKILKK